MRKRFLLRRYWFLSKTLWEHKLCMSKVLYKHCRIKLQDKNDVKPIFCHFCPSRPYVTKRNVSVPPCYVTNHRFTPLRSIFRLTRAIVLHMLKVIFTHIQRSSRESKETLLKKRLLLRSATFSPTTEYFIDKVQHNEQNLRI